MVGCLGQSCNPSRPLVPRGPVDDSILYFDVDVRFVPLALACLHMETWLITTHASQQTSTASWIFMRKTVRQGDSVQHCGCNRSSLHLSLYHPVYLCLSQMAVSKMASHAMAQPMTMMALGSLLMSLSYFASSTPAVTHSPWKKSSTSHSSKASKG